MRETDGLVEGGRPLLAFGFAVPTAALGGLTGLGGAEFRLPVLAGAPFATPSAARCR